MSHLPPVKMHVLCLLASDALHLLHESRWEYHLDMELACLILCMTMSILPGLTWTLTRQLTAKAILDRSATVSSAGTKTATWVKWVNLGI